MLKTLLNLVIVLPLAVVLVVLAVANRDLVTLSLDPLARAASPYTITVPLFVVILGALMLGVLVGGLAMWWTQGAHRREERRHRREAERLRAEAERRVPEAGDTLALPPIRRA